MTKFLAALSIEVLRHQKRLDHFFRGLGAGADVLQRICDRELPVPQPVPIGQNVVVLKHLLIIANGIVQFNETSVIVFKSTVSFTKKLLS